MNILFVFDKIATPNAKLLEEYVNLKVATSASGLVAQRPRAAINWLVRGKAGSIAGLTHFLDL